MQALGYGMDLRKELLAGPVDGGVKTAHLQQRCKVVRWRGYRSKGFLRGDGPTTVPIHEGKAQFTVDIGKGRRPGGFVTNVRIDWRRPCMPRESGC